MKIRAVVSVLSVGVFLNLVGCASTQKVNLSDHLMDVAYAGLMQSQEGKTLEVRSDLPSSFSHKQGYVTFTFDVNRAINSQLKELFDTKYAGKQGDTVQISVHSLVLDANWENEKAVNLQLLFGAAPGTTHTYKATAKLLMTVRFQDGSVTKIVGERDASNYVNLNSDLGPIRDVLKSAIEGSITNAIVKLNKALDLDHA